MELLGHTQDACMDMLHQSPSSLHQCMAGEVRVPQSFWEQDNSSCSPSLGCLVSSDWSSIPFPPHKKKVGKKHITCFLAQERMVCSTSSVLTDINPYKVLLNKLPAVGTNIPNNKDPVHYLDKFTAALYLLCQDALSSECICWLVLIIRIENSLIFAHSQCLLCQWRRITSGVHT